MKIRGTDIRLFFAVGLTLTGFLITVTAFTQVYKQHNYLPYPEAQTIPEEARIKEASFIATGDIMLSRNVARHAEKAGRTDWMWDNIASYLRSADFVFGNLEGATNGTDVYSYQKVLTFNALPKLIETLTGVNFSMLNLANNHAMDQGEK